MSVSDRGISGAEEEGWGNERKGPGPLPPHLLPHNPCLFVSNLLLLPSLHLSLFFLPLRQTIFLLRLHIHPACHRPLHPSIKSLPYLTLQIHLGVLRGNAARTCSSLIRGAHRPVSSRNDVQIAENKSWETGSSVWESWFSRWNGFQGCATSADRQECEIF